MKHTETFLRLDLGFDIATPTQNQIRFDSIAYRALSDLQDKINEAETDLDYAQSQTAPHNVEFVAKQLIAESRSLPGVIRVEGAGKERHQEIINDAAEKGQTLVSMQDLGLSHVAFYFLPAGVTRESFLDGARENAAAKLAGEVTKAQQRVTMFKDDMRSLKKAVQARQAEIKPLSKLLAEF